MIIESDYIVDLGPEAGVHGGQVMFCGDSKLFIKNNNITSVYLNGQKKIETPKIRRKGNGKKLILEGDEEII